MPLKLASEEIPVQGTDILGWLRSIVANDGSPALAVDQKGAGSLLSLKQDGAEKVSVTNAGELQAIAGALVRPGSAGSVGLTVKGVASQAEDLAQWQDASASLLLKVTAGGHLYPGADNSISLGAATLRFANVFATLLDLSTQGNQGRRINGTGTGLRFGADNGLIFHADSGLNDAIMTVGGASAHVTLAEGKNLILGTTTGTKIGTATTQKLGFWNAAPVAQQTVSGSRGGNAALADLLTKLATLGLIVDSTTA